MTDIELPSGWEDNIDDTLELLSSNYPETCSKMRLPEKMLMVLLCNKKPIQEEFIQDLLPDKKLAHVF